MTPTRLVAIAAAVSLCAGAIAPAGAQQRPNFSGRWVIVEPVKGAGQEQVIKHDDKTLLKTPVSEKGGPPSSYQLDGLEHRNVIPMRGEQIVIVTKAALEGNTVVINSTENYPNGMKLTVKEVWSLDDRGRLVVDSTESAERQPPQTTKVVMQKKG